MNADPAPARTVILVHGFLDTARMFDPMARFLRREGWDVRAVTLRPNRGQVSLDVLGRQLADFIEREIPAGHRLDLVGFSMGGLVCRSYLQNLGGHRRADRLITISTPHHGTWLAFFLGNTGIRQMRPRSPYLNALNADTTALRHLRLTSIWTPLDLMILPAKSSRLPDAREIVLWIPAHPLMILLPASLRAVAAALRE